MGKGGDQQLKGKEPKDVLIDGRYYDVSKMKHPGGNVVLTYANNNRDATIAFDQFHYRSRKAKKMLEALPSRSADEKALEKEALPGQLEMLKDFRELQFQLESEGLFQPSPLHVAYRITELVMWHVVSLWLLFNGYVVPGTLMLGFAQGRCMTLLHESSHNSLTGNLKVDAFIDYFVAPLGCGLSQSWWRRQHNRHHAAPQRLDHDVDLKTLPFVAFTEKVATKKLGVPQRWWIRFQAFLFPLIGTSLIGISWQFLLQPMTSIKTRKYGECFMLALRYALWTYFITGTFGVAKTAAIYLVCTWICWNYLMLQFAMNHSHLGTVAADDNSVDWVRYATRYTMNINPGPLSFVTWFMVYLNYQTEHHLFPCLPQFRCSLIAPRVKALCEKHGLPYQTCDYSKAMYTTFSNLHNVGEDVFYG